MAAALIEARLLPIGPRISPQIVEPRVGWLMLQSDQLATTELAKAGGPVRPNISLLFEFAIAVPHSR
ncbi:MULTISPECIES: hypothetical protein [Bradyrhizobium]|uniref:hypothetical protein n=1 Tax=Bradyrhizobium TaxID=374 RepID=UPI00155E51D1|nr:MULTISPECIES: hypothetical protein [Bradyrhizobium]